MQNINRMPSQQGENEEQPQSVQPPSIAALRSEALEGQTSPQQVKIEKIDRDIEALETQKREGRMFIAKMTSKEMIDIAEKTEDAINAEIAKLELQKQALLGQKPN